MNDENKATTQTNERFFPSLCYLMDSDGATTTIRNETLVLFGGFSDQLHSKGKNRWSTSISGDNNARHDLTIDTEKVYWQWIHPLFERKSGETPYTDARYYVYKECTAEIPYCAAKFFQSFWWWWWLTAQGSYKTQEITRICALQTSAGKLMARTESAHSAPLPLIACAPPLFPSGLERLGVTNQSLCSSFKRYNNWRDKKQNKRRRIRLLGEYHPGCILVKLPRLETIKSNHKVCYRTNKQIILSHLS